MPCKEALRHGASELVVGTVRTEESTSPTAAIREIATAAFASESGICGHRDARTAHCPFSNLRHERFLFGPIDDGIDHTHCPGCPGE